MFPEPSAWLEARLNYGRTLAVMSMVGHVLGYVYKLVVQKSSEKSDPNTFNLLLPGWVTGMGKTSSLTP